MKIKHHVIKDYIATLMGMREQVTIDLCPVLYDNNIDHKE